MWLSQYKYRVVHLHRDCNVMIIFSLKWESLFLKWQASFILMQCQGLCQSSMDYYGIFIAVKIPSSISMLKSMLVYKDFQNWHLIDWQHRRQPIRSHDGKSLLTNMAFNLDFTEYTRGPDGYIYIYIELKWYLSTGKVMYFYHSI